MATITGGKPLEKNSGRYRFEKRAIGVAHCCCGCAMQTKEVFTGDMTCKDNDRLVTMHTSNTCRSVRYKNKWHHWFLRRSRSFTGEEDDDEYPCGETKVPMAFQSLEKGQ